MNVFALSVGDYYASSWVRLAVGLAAALLIAIVWAFSDDKGPMVIITLVFAGAFPFLADEIAAVAFDQIDGSAEGYRNTGTVLCMLALIMALFAIGAALRGGIMIGSHARQERVMGVLVGIAAVLFAGRSVLLWTGGVGSYAIERGQASGLPAIPFWGLTVTAVITCGLIVAATLWQRRRPSLVIGA